MSAELEQQIRTVADAAFDQTAPVRYDELVVEHEAAESGSRRRWWLIAAASVLVVVLVGGIAWVGGSDDAPVAPVETAAPATTESEETTMTEPLRPAPDFSTEFSARGVLSEIPLPGGEPVIGFRIGGAELAALAELVGIERSGRIDQSPPGDWFDLLFIEESFALPESRLLIDALQEPDGFESEFGFSFLDVDRFAAASNYLGASVDDLAWPFDAVVLGRDEVTALAENAGADSIVDIGQGADGRSNVDDRTVFRPIGRPLRVGIDESRSMVAVSKSTPFVTAWLETDGSTMADVSDLAAAAAVLDRDAELYAAQFEIFNRDLDDFDPEITEDRSASDLPIVEEFTTMALGSSGIAETHRTTIVYVFADERAASASVNSIESLYAPDTDIRAAGFDGIETVGDVFLLDEATVVGRTVAVSGRAGTRGADKIRRVFLGNLYPFIAHR